MSRTNHTLRIHMGLPYSKTMLSKEKGMTLLELLIVVAILSATALMTIASVDGQHDQVRFEQNQNRLLQIKKAIIGQRILNSQSQLLVDGFVADMGRLPETLKELTTKLTDCDADGSDDSDSDSNGIGDSCQWHYDSDAQIWSGWRGPYLATFADKQGYLSYLDSWGNQGDGNNFGWYYNLSDGDSDGLKDDLVIQSLGKDRSVNPASASTYALQSDYEQDYPRSQSPLSDPTQDPLPLIEQKQHQVNLQSLKFHFHLINPCTVDGDGHCSGPNLSTADLATAINDLRVRIYYPQHGAIINDWPATVTDRDDAVYLSQIFAIDSFSVSDDSEQIATFAYDVNDKWIPWGQRAYALVNEADGSLYSDPGLSLTFPQNLTVIPETTPADIHIYWRLE